MTALSTRADAAGSEKCSSSMTVRMGASLLVRKRVVASFAGRQQAGKSRASPGLIKSRRRIEPPHRLPATNDRRDEPAGADAMIIKIVIAVVVLLVGAVVASRYLDFNPTIPIFIVLMAGIVLVGLSGGPDGHVGYRGGHGIYFNRDDQWVAGQDSRDHGDDDARP